MDSKANPQTFSNGTTYKCTAGSSDYTCAFTTVNSCNTTYEVTSGSVIGVSPSAGFLKNYMWYLIIGGVVILLCGCGFCFHHRRKSHHHDSV